ncbi:MAG: MBL fold metallo-hydrolase [Bauldia sp.]|nr:MBL fold metallo-hydrolase [Bauldia sp.]
MARHRFTIMGCGASPGVPRINGDWGACDPREPKNLRTRCSALIERFGDGREPTRVVIDTGPDLRAQLLAANVTSIDGVVYTHSHADHVHGIDDLRAFWMNAQRRVPVYTDDATQERLDQGFGYCFATPPGSAYPPFLDRHRLTPGVPLTIDGPGGPVSLLPYRQTHGDIESLGFRLGGLAYSCDISDVPEDSLPFLADLDIWIVDALRPRPHPSHLSLDQALDWIDRIKPRRAILTHMTTDLDYNALHRDLPAHIEPAYDGMTFELDIDR